MIWRARATTLWTRNPGAKQTLRVCVERGDGISVILDGGSSRTWNKIRYRTGLSAKNVGASKLSMKVTTVPPGGVAFAQIHGDLEVMLYILAGRVRPDFGPGLSRSVENGAGDFIYIESGVSHQVFHLSQSEPVVAVVARSDTSEWE